MSSLVHFTDYLKDMWKNIFQLDKNKKMSNSDYLDEKNKIYEFTRIAKTNYPTKVDLGETPEYERMVYNEKSEDEIKKEAENALKEYYDAGIKKLESEDEQAKKLKEQQVLNAENAFAQKSAEIDKEFEQERKKTVNETIKNGIARSSIAQKQDDNLNIMQADAKNQTKAELNSRISELESEISDLAIQREKALNSFNVAYATKLSSQINSLKKEQENAKKEVLKYNNSLDEKEQKEKVNQHIKEEEAYALAVDSYEKVSSEIDDAYYEQLYVMMDSMLSKMPKRDARQKILEDMFFSAYLDEKRFNRLFNKYVNY